MLQICTLLVICARESAENVDQCLKCYFYLMSFQGCCWGADNYLNFQYAKKLQISFKKTVPLISDKVWKIYKKYEYYSEFFDMIWLRHRLWPQIKKKSLIFDSYHCMKHSELGVGHPYPTK